MWYVVHICVYAHTDKKVLFCKKEKKNINIIKYNLFSLSVSFDLTTQLIVMNKMAETCLWV